MKFNASIGLPVCFDDIDITEDEFDLMADRILTSTEWQYRPQDVTREKFIACMKEQNKIGQEFKNRLYSYKCTVEYLHAIPSGKSLEALHKAFMKTNIFADFPKLRGKINEKVRINWWNRARIHH